jgi:hypothetical protein
LKIKLSRVDLVHRILTFRTSALNEKKKMPEDEKYIHRKNKHFMLNTLIKLLEKEKKS